MSVIVILIAASLLVALVFLAGFIWAVRAGQYDDTSTPSLRVLTEETPVGNDTHRRSFTPHPGPLPSEGRGGASCVAGLPMPRSAPVHSVLPSHSESESNRP